MGEFESKVVAVTGGGTGIGRAVAEAFLAQGASVVINGRRADVLEATAQALDSTGRRVATLAGDISKSRTATQLVDTATRRFGGLDVLVNNAGIFRPLPFLDHGEADLAAYVDVVLKGTFYASQAAVPALRKRNGGAIVNVGSMWALQAVGATPRPPTRPPRPACTRSPATWPSSWLATASGSTPWRLRSWPHRCTKRSCPRSRCAAYWPRTCLSSPGPARPGDGRGGRHRMPGGRWGGLDHRCDPARGRRRDGGPPRRVKTGRRALQYALRTAAAFRSGAAERARSGAIGEGCLPRGRRRSRRPGMTLPAWGRFPTSGSTSRVDGQRSRQ